MLEIMLVDGSDTLIVGPFFSIFTRGGDIYAARTDESPGFGAVAQLAKRTEDGWLRDGKTWKEFSILEVKVN